MILFLVRHGQTDWNKEKRIQGLQPVPLNEEGFAQAKKLADFFKNIELDCIIASPLERTMQTAEVISGATSVPIQTDSAFQDRAHGDHEGLLGEELRKLIPDLKVQWAKAGIDWTRGGVETVRDLQLRVRKGFDELLRAHKGETVLIVTHDIIIKSIVHYLHNGKLETVFERESVDNAGIIKAELKNGKWIVESVSQ